MAAVAARNSQWGRYPEFASALSRQARHVPAVSQN
jgi:hypothetical protein